MNETRRTISDWDKFAEATCPHRRLEATVVGDKRGLNQFFKPSVQKVRDSAIVKGDNGGHGGKDDGAGDK